MAPPTALAAPAPEPTPTAPDTATPPTEPGTATTTPEPAPTPAPEGDLLTAPPGEPSPPEPEPEPKPTPETALPPLRTEPAPEPPPVIGADTAPLPEPAPRHKLIYSNALVVRLNPLGLEDRFALMYRRRLSARTGKLYDDTFIGVGITPTVSPSISRFGPHAPARPPGDPSAARQLLFHRVLRQPEIQGSPVRLARRRLRPRHPQRPRRRQTGDQHLRRPGRALGPVAGQVRTDRRAQRAHLLQQQHQAAGRNNSFYDLRHDILAPARGWFLSNDTDVIYSNTKLRLNVGVRGTYYHLFYPDNAYAPGDTIAGTNHNDHARVGPLVSYAFKDRPAARFTKPTIFFTAQWWLKHRYRTGQEVSQGIPMMVLGFSFTGELWSKK